ncbi:hypothetical protein BDV19DRAFT_371994 [Aspergillus venezuelensis]
MGCIYKLRYPTVSHSIAGALVAFICLIAFSCSLSAWFIVFLSVFVYMLEYSSYCFDYRLS